MISRLNQKEVRKQTIYRQPNETEDPIQDKQQYWHQAIAEQSALLQKDPSIIELRHHACVWTRLGFISYRLCTNNHQCTTCEFDQIMYYKLTSGVTDEHNDLIGEMKRKPGSQRLCRHVINGNVSIRLCTHQYMCSSCEFNQMMEDKIEQKLAKIGAWRRALNSQRESLST